MDAADLAAWYAPHLAPGGGPWVAERQAAPVTLRSTAISIGQAPRRVGTAPLPTPPGGWPRHWRVDQAVRVDLARRLIGPDLETIFATADVEESLALYQGLAFLPVGAARAAEGVRSNLSAVFHAVALDNPAPAACLDDGAFNQLVVKAVFLGADLDRIHGLAARWNTDLHRMLADLVRERTAAGRPMDPRVLTLLKA